MTKSGLPKSTRKFIRLEKARIRAQFFDVKKQEEMIGELYRKFVIAKDGAGANIGSKAVETSLNPKSEILNPKQIPNSKPKKQKAARVKSKTHEKKHNKA